jgi:hypothetical protein
MKTRRSGKEERSRLPAVRGAPSPTALYLGYPPRNPYSPSRASPEPHLRDTSGSPTGQLTSSIERKDRELCRREGESLEEFRRRVESKVQQLENERVKIVESQQRRKIESLVEASRSRTRALMVQHFAKVIHDVPDEAEKAKFRDNLLWEETQRDGIQTMKAVHGGALFLRRYANEAAMQKSKK